jgi:hypothetical protein
MMWLERTPPAVINACLEMIPKLDAEEQIDRVNVTALGSGHVADDDGPVLRRKLQSAAAGRAASTRKPVDPSPLIQQGFAVRRIKRKKKVAAE